jgi:hypothetical protein
LEFGDHDYQIEPLRTQFAYELYPRFLCIQGLKSFLLSILSG